MVVISFSGQIIFLDKVLYISKRQNKNKKNAVDMDGKPISPITYSIAFHYENGEISQIVYSTEEERDADYQDILTQLGLDKKEKVSLFLNGHEL